MLSVIAQQTRESTAWGGDPAERPGVALVAEKPSSEGVTKVEELGEIAIVSGLAHGLFPDRLRRIELGRVCGEIEEFDCVGVVPSPFPHNFRVVVANVVGNQKDFCLG